MNRLSLFIGALPAFALMAGCSDGFNTHAAVTGASSFHIVVSAVNGDTHLPTEEKPLPAPPVDQVQTWAFSLEARTPTGEIDTTFTNREVRLSVRPGTVVGVTGPSAHGRNAHFTNGKTSGTVAIKAVYGPARLWVEDLGYAPAPAGQKTRCSDGIDNDGDGLIDFPADPGCAYSNDTTETGGNFAAGVSLPVQYALPKVSDVRGHGSATPYPYEAIEIDTTSPERLIVTRVANDGFYVTDVNAAEMAGGYNSVFAFNFSTPPGMQVCDHITYLSGTANDFFGFTELSFPSYQLDFPIKGQANCEVPEPVVLATDKPPMKNIINDPIAMQKLQSSLVRVENVTIAANLGPDLAKDNVFSKNASNCDFNGDGQIDFTDPLEGSCATTCDADPTCSEWTAYSARGDVKVSLNLNAATMIKISTGTIAGFDPVASRGQKLESVSGTMRKFSGGTLNWTIETRCSDDLVCKLPGCVLAPVSSQAACVSLRTTDDNDEGTN